MGQQQQQQYGNNSNFSNSSNSNNVYRPPGYHQRKYDEGSSAEKKPGLEDMMMKFMSKIDNTVESLASTVHTVKAATDQNTASIKLLERQMGQISDALQNRAPGQFPSQPDKKPKENCNAIYLRSGRELIRESTRDPIVEEDSTTTSTVKPIPVEEIEVEKEKEVKKPETDEKKRVEASEARVNPISVPYPSRLKAHNEDVKYAKFLDIFKKLHINIPFADALAQMPSYVKFLKDILSNKRKIEEYATVALTEECSAILQHKLPPKLKDPGSFTIPVQIGTSEFGKSLCDLGASINLMPLSIFRKLGLGEVQPTNMILQLADRSINYPYGVIEDVLVKVDRFYLPADFVILDIDEDEEIPLILGRPFLATGGALIDVKAGKLTLRVGEEKSVFNVFQAEKGNTENAKCFRVDVMDSTPQQEHSRQWDEDELMKAVGGLDTNAEKEMVGTMAKPIHKLTE